MVTMKPCLPIFAHIKRYEDRVNMCITAKLHPGDYYITREKEMITTVLGSCVSACIYDPSLGIGGMNHFMLPVGNSGNGDEDSARYGLFAMESLLNELYKAGCRKANLRFKLFGGGQILKDMSDIGGRNVSFAKTFLSKEGFKLESSDVGLIYPRKVNFFPHNGSAMVKRLEHMHNTTIWDREQNYALKINRRKIGGEIELF